MPGQPAHDRASHAWAPGDASMRVEPYKPYQILQAFATVEAMHKTLSAGARADTSSGVVVGRHEIHPRLVGRPRTPPARGRSPPAEGIRRLARRRTEEPALGSDNVVVFQRFRHQVMAKRAWDAGRQDCCKRCRLDRLEPAAGFAHEPVQAAGIEPPQVRRAGSVHRPPVLLLEQPAADRQETSAGNDDPGRREYSVRVKILQLFQQFKKWLPPGSVDADAVAGAVILVVIAGCILLRPCLAAFVSSGANTCTFRYRMTFSRFRRVSRNNRATTRYASADPSLVIRPPTSMMCFNCSQLKP